MQLDDSCSCVLRNKLKNSVLVVFKLIGSEFDILKKIQWSITVIVGSCLSFLKCCALHIYINAWTVSADMCEICNN